VRRVAITGIGLVSPVGNDAGTVFDTLMDGRSGIVPVTWEHGDRSFHYAAGSADFDAAALLPGYKAHTLASMDRVAQMGLAAAAQAVADAALTPDVLDPERSGVYLGTGMGGAGALEQSYEQLLLRDPDRLKPLTVPMVMNNAAAAHIATAHKLKGPNVTYSCACASAGVAIGEAFRQIRHGYSDVMLAGGAEALLTFGMFQAWSALRTLAAVDATDASRSCKPFAANRSGLVLAEGAAVLVLEEMERAQARGARIYGELAGYGCTNDAAHITRPSVDGQARAMELALQEAGITPAQVDYINAHGTSTRANDATETASIKQVFGADAARIPVSSTKSMHGHLLGAAAALEFAVATLAMSRGAIPPTAHLDEPDPECDLDYVPGVGRSGLTLNTVMSNAFAFGGTNAVLVARACES